jgi:hypothetical protein
VRVRGPEHAPEAIQAIAEGRCFCTVIVELRRAAPDTTMSGASAQNCFSDSRAPTSATTRASTSAGSHSSTHSIRGFHVPSHLLARRRLALARVARRHRRLHPAQPRQAGAAAEVLRGRRPAHGVSGRRAAAGVRAHRYHHHRRGLPGRDGV